MARAHAHPSLNHSEDYGFVLRAARAGRVCLAFSDVLGDASVIHVTHGKNTSMASASVGLAIGGTIGSADRFNERLGAAHGPMARTVLEAVVEARAVPSEALKLLTQALVRLPLPPPPPPPPTPMPPTPPTPLTPTQGAQARAGGHMGTASTIQLFRELLPRGVDIVGRGSAWALTGVNAGTRASLQQLLSNRPLLHNALRSLGVAKLGGRLSLINALQQLVDDS